MKHSHDVQEAQIWLENQIYNSQGRKKWENTKNMENVFSKIRAEMFPSLQNK